MKGLVPLANGFQQGLCVGGVGPTDNGNLLAEMVGILVDRRMQKRG
jgi:hypothetical protein